MLAWVMNLGFAATPANQPAVPTGTSEIFIGAVIAVRGWILVPLLGLLLERTHHV